MPKWVKTGCNFIKGTAKEVPGYTLDLVMGLSNSIDENLAFGFGNKIRENLGVDAYEPYDKSYYNGTYSVGEVGSTVANVYTFVTGVSALTNVKNIFKGGMSVAKVSTGSKAVAGGYSVVIDSSAAIQTNNRWCIIWLVCWKYHVF